MENLLLRSNVPFFTIFKKILHFKGGQRRLCGVKGSGKPLGIMGENLH